jgi:hypothetical protein
VNARSNEPVAEGELLDFRLVGERRYIRGLDVLGLAEERFPGFLHLDLKFLRPVAARAMFSRTRQPGTAVIVSIVRSSGDRVELFIVNLDPVEIVAEEEPALVSHLVLPRLGSHHRYLLVGRHSPAAILAVVFHRYQAALGQRFVLKSLSLEGMECRGTELVSLKTSYAGRGRHTGAICRNRRPWCRIEVVEFEASGLAALKRRTENPG